MATSEVIILVIQQLLPMGLNHINRHLEKEHQKELHELERKAIEKKEMIINRMPKTHISHKEKNNSIPEIPVFQFQEGDDVATLGNRMWTTYHETSLQLPDNASPQQVKQYLKSVEHSIKNHPCEECKTHALENLKKVPLKASTKKEAVERIYEFHNSVNTMLDKKPFTKQQFKNTYHYTI